MTNDYIDGDFTVEDGAPLADQPEWRVWMYFGAAKYVEATRRLRYLGTSGGLYHYEDRRDGAHYTLPLIEQVREHFHDARQAETHNVVSRKRWKLAWAFWGATLVALFYAGVKSHPSHHPDLANAIGMTMIILFLVGGIMLALGQYASKRRPVLSPRHTMFYTDVELETQERTRRQKQILVAGATAVYFAYRFHEHNQEHLADLIADRERGHGLNGSEWHQHY